MPEQVREATLPRIPLPRDVDTIARRAVNAPPQVPIPWAGVLLSVAGFVLALTTQSWAMSLGALGCIVIAALVALIRGEGARIDVGLVAWGAGPLGVVLAAGAGLLAWLENDSRAGLAGAALAAAAMVARSWLDVRARKPVADVVHRLAVRMPPRARIPNEDNATRYVEVPTSELRVGSEVLVIEGETLPVDGVVMSGEAKILPHPTAQFAIAASAGTNVLAGARVQSGALRIVASRVGSERGLMLSARFGDLRGPGSARIARLADRTTRVGGLVALIAAPFGLVLTGDPGLAGQISAAAAVLLAAPLLAARRGAESPFIAAAASAASRGIIYRTPRAMEAAGRVTTAAICTSGVITVGTPEVVEVKTVGKADVDVLLGLIAGAEAKIIHPIASALRNYVRSRGIAPAEVRRATLIPSRGVRALTASGVSFLVGTRQLLLDEGVSVAVADSVADETEQRGQTALFVAHDGRVRAVVSIQDIVRPGARAAVQQLFDLSIDVVLLSGDHRATVAALAKPLDVANVKAELVPAEQAEAVRQLKGSGGLVAVAGRVAPNAQPLEQADVPIQLAHGGVPETGGIATTSADVRDAAAALWIARAVRAEATRSIALAIGAGGVLVAGAALGWVVPAAAATLAVAVDAFALPSGARLLRRIRLRLPGY